MSKSFHRFFERSDHALRDQQLLPLVLGEVPEFVRLLFAPYREMEMDTVLEELL